MSTLLIVVLGLVLVASIVAVVVLVVLFPVLLVPTVLIGAWPLLDIAGTCGDPSHRLHDRRDRR